MIETILVVFVLAIMLTRFAPMVKNNISQLFLKMGCVFMFLVLGTTTLYTYNTSIEIIVGFGTMILYLYYFRSNFIVPKSNKNDA